MEHTEHKKKQEPSGKTWLGSIVVAYRTNPVRVLLIENTETGNVTTISGAVEGEETQKEAAVRELQEEVKWKISTDILRETGVVHEFIYGEKKKERAGDKGSNQVFLLDANVLEEPSETTDTRNPIWVNPQEAQALITFDDLKQVVSDAIKLIPEDIE